MSEKTISSLTDYLLLRRLPGGGFANQVGGVFRADATAWAIIALKSRNPGAPFINSAREQLVAHQLQDGRMGVTPSHPEAFWPTSLALLAWQNAPVFQEPQRRAVRFLLNHQGKSLWSRPRASSAHNSSLKGWPWIVGTFSWVEPTAMAIIALELANKGGENQITEARQMLLDRQLPQGGWNYGNTLVFGQELAPTPDSTGIALNAVRSQESKGRIQTSLNYLRTNIGKWRTPRALSWALLGLGAWAERPPQASDWIAESLERQNKYGTYDTLMLSLLLCALLSPGGIQEII